MTYRLREPMRRAGVEANLVTQLLVVLCWTGIIPVWRLLPDAFVTAALPSSCW